MRKKAMGLVTLMLLGMAVTGCGSDSNDTSSGGSDQSGGSSEAEAALAKWYEGTDRALPTEAPAPTPGKNVWVIACASAAEGCAVPSKAIEEAGEKIGWKMKVFDGQFNPSEQANGIRAAVANKADAIVLIAVDCPNVQTPLEEAKKAGVKIYGAFSLDCDEVDGPKLFDGYSTFDTERSQYGAYLQEIHDAVVVDWVTAKTDGKGHVLVVDQTDSPNAQFESEGFKKLFPEVCPDCTISHVEFTGMDLVSGNLTSLVAAALTKDPTVNVVVAPYDAAITAGVGPAVQQQAGRDILVAGYEGLSANIEQIKAGGPSSMATGFPSRWVGWSAVDEVNRILSDAPLVDEGMGYQAIDKDHNIPADTTYYDGNVDGAGKAKQDYEANFLKIWGVN